MFCLSVCLSTDESVDELLFKQMSLLMNYTSTNESVDEL